MGDRSHGEVSLLDGDFEALGFLVPGCTQYLEHCGSFNGCSLAALDDASGGEIPEITVPAFLLGIDFDHTWTSGFEYEGGCCSLRHDDQTNSFEIKQIIENEYIDPETVLGVWDKHGASAAKALLHSYAQAQRPLKNLEASTRTRRSILVSESARSVSFMADVFKVNSAPPNEYADQRAVSPPAPTF